MLGGPARTDAWLLVGVLSLASGCAFSHADVDRALLTDSSVAARQARAADAYRLASPDVLELYVDGRADLTGRRPIGPDGCIDIGATGRLRVEGLNCSEVGRRLAGLFHLPPEWVQVRVGEFNSQQIHLLGQVVGHQRPLPYRGPETVVDLLNRAGGITPGAASERVYVVRSHISTGGRPELFRVNLEDILLQHDTKTNIILQPEDQVFVGESERFGFERALPPWLRPTYESLLGMAGPEVASPPVK